MDRILLLLEHPTNRRLLEECLAQHYQVATETGQAPESSFDLVILDGPALERLSQDVAGWKRVAEPVFLPLLLLTPRQHTGMVTHHLLHTVDELLLTPVDRAELRARVEILLRTRRQSLALKRRNDELEAFIEARRAFERMKDEFIAMASHELRAPLTSITLYAHMLVDGEAGTLSEEQLSFVHIVSSNADRLTRLVNDLLDVSRLASGRLQLTLRAVDLKAIVQQVCTELQAVGDSKRIQTVATLPPQPVHVKADQGRLVQILTNLLSNAYKYSPEESTVTVQVHPQAQRAQVDVIDQGMGIAALDQSQLFSKFFRTEEAKRQGIGGTGLGLYITRALVEMQDGQIWITSRQGEGSTFSFTLPLAL
jgi:signal transduction histidine kinase